jgi:hypothetical protein
VLLSHLLPRILPFRTYIYALSAASAGVIDEYLCSGRNRLRTLSIGGNRLGNVGTVPVENVMRADTHVQQLYLASVGMGAAGGEAIATMVFQ